MKALATKLKNGNIDLIEIPPPKLNGGFVLVKNHYSLISAGTESSTLKASKKSYYGKAKAKPDQFAKVIESLKAQGPISTYRNVMKKLDAYSPMGYSSSGEVIAVGEGVNDFDVGDLVACSGVGYANHAEIVSVPKNLCVKLDLNANLINASYNSLGGIALQSVRQADLKLGEKCAVIGLGLVGQLTCKLLKASGINVIGIDIDDFAVDFSKEKSVDNAFNSYDDSLLEKISHYTDSIGVDGVIIAASTSSLDPINLAGEICRAKAKVIILGDVPTGFKRDAFYRKELVLKMSCSYGPGRYDINYEEKGIDYPPEHVRWTEKRNMQMFQDFLSGGLINIDELTTKVVELNNYHEAYDLLLSKNKTYFGLVLRYNVKNYENKQTIQINSKNLNASICMGMIGAGNYAQSFILPNIPHNSSISKKVLITNNGTTSRKIAEKYNFEICTNDIDTIFKDDEINLVFILSRHNSHAKFVIKALQSNKNLYCEKPLCLNEKDLNKIVKLIGNQKFYIGYNRRFAPISLKIRSLLSSNPLIMLCRINAGTDTSWANDEEIGGGKIIGEICHFIDLLTYFCNSSPCSVSAKKISNPDKKHTNVSIIMKFENESVANIVYTSMGSNNLEKEYYELHQDGISYVINDFKSCKIIKDNRVVSSKNFVQNKGQNEMMKSIFKNISGKENLIDINDIISTSKASFAIEKSLRSKGDSISV
jgi:predicted dehydrogenase/threonine dehydrogenase-like Zn-dependent dehydrogenase